MIFLEFLAGLAIGFVLISIWRSGPKESSDEKKMEFFLTKVQYKIREEIKSSSHDIIQAIAPLTRETIKQQLIEEQANKTNVASLLERRKDIMWVVEGNWLRLSKEHKNINGQIVRYSESCDISRTDLEKFILAFTSYVPVDKSDFRNKGMKTNNVLDIYNRGKLEKEGRLDKGNGDWKEQPQKEKIPTKRTWIDKILFWKERRDLKTDTELFWE